MDLPEECRLNVALKLAREWVHKETGQTGDAPAAGQSDPSNVVGMTLVDVHGFDSRAGPRVATYAVIR